MNDYSGRLFVILTSILVATLIVTVKFPPKFGVDLKGGMNLIGSLNMEAFEDLDPGAQAPEAKDLIPYIIAQLVGAIAGAGILYLIVSNQSGFSGVGGFAANGFGEHSPGGYNMTAALVTEIAIGQPQLTDTGLTPTRTTYHMVLTVLGADRVHQHSSAARGH